MRKNCQVLFWKKDMNNDNRAAPVMMSVNDAADYTSLSRSLVVLMSKEGQFPRAVQLGERRLAYVRAEVEAWLSEKIAARAA
jgi:prophage regulatory protein